MSFCRFSQERNNFIIRFVYDIRDDSHMLLSVPTLSCQKVSVWHLTTIAYLMRTATQPATDVYIITQAHHFLSQGIHGNVDGALLPAVLVLVAARPRSSLPCLLVGLRPGPTPAFSEHPGRFQTRVVKGSTRVGQLYGIGTALWPRSWTSRLPQSSCQAGIHGAVAQSSLPAKDDKTAIK